MNMRHLLFPLFAFFLLLSACSTEEASEYERTSAMFLDSIGGNVSAMHWWRTAVKLKVNVITDQRVILMLLSSQNSTAMLYDYKEVATSETVTMTAPQGQTSTLYLKYLYNGRTYTKTITLSGKAEENVTVNTTTRSGLTRADERPASLCGSSIRPLKSFGTRPKIIISNPVDSNAWA